MIIILYILFVRTNEQTLWSRLEDFHNLTPYLKALYFVQSLVTTYSQGLLLYSFLNNSNLFATGTKVATVGEGSNKKIAKENSRRRKKMKMSCSTWGVMRDQKEKNQLKISFIMERVIITFLIIKYIEKTSQEDNVTRIKELLATRDFWGIDQPLYILTFWRNWEVFRMVKLKQRYVYISILLTHFNFHDNNFKVS